MSDQPNILWIVATQWRGQACGYAGDANARTPWLDGLASEAVNFTQAVTPHPLGPQARAALLTGRLCPENGVSDYYDPLPVYEPGTGSGAGASDGPGSPAPATTKPDNPFGGLRPLGKRTSRPTVGAAAADLFSRGSSSASGTGGTGGQRPPRHEPGRTVAHALNDRGYATGFFGKWHLSPRDRTAPFVGEAHARQIVPPERRGGFSLWEGFEGGFQLNDPWLHGTRLERPRQFKGYQSDILCQRAAQWCREQGARSVEAGVPYFCLLSLEAPHPPYHAPAPHVHELPPGEVHLRANVPPGGEPERQARAELAGYYAHIEATDRAIGRLLTELDLSGTTVVFTSVHGDMHGSHGLFRKAWPYEESVRVPLLIRRQRTEDRRKRTEVRGQATGEDGRRDDSPVSLVDLPHIAVAWAEGREWRCKSDSAAISMPAPTAIAQQCPHVWRGFRTPQHKFVLKREADGSERPWLYFDLKHDPLELHNLADRPEQARAVAELRALL
ncbi:MAG: sulfatase-like hydrolase/transferase [Opitutales bacterium]